MISRQEVTATEQKRIDMPETANYTIKRIQCQQGQFRRCLFEASVEGIWVQCKECGRAHLKTWEELFLLHEEFRPKLVRPLEDQVS